MPAVKGSEIRERRERLGLKRSQLASRVDISREHLACLELGYNTAAIEVVYRIATVLGARAEDLLAEPDGNAA